MIPFEHLGVKHIEGLGTHCRSACAFQSLLVVQPEKHEPSPMVPGMQLIQITDTEYPSYLLSLQCSIRHNEVAVHASYDSSALSSDVVHDIVSQFEHMLKIVFSTTVEQTVDQLNLIHSLDFDRLMMWNSVDLSLVYDTVPWAIERHMKLDPNAPAVCFERQEISYGQLDRLSACLAFHLRELGIGPEKVVPLCFDKSIWAVVAVVAVLRAGGACVGLDPGHPATRHQEILDIVRATLVLASPKYGKAIESRDVRVLHVDDSLQIDFNRPASTNISERLVNPENAAFVVFTSGSTGVPKGIVLEHAAVCATSRGNGAVLELASSSRVLQFASFAFDVAVEDICITLMHGACICIASEHDRLNDLSGTIREMGVTWADLTPSVARTIDVEDVPSLRTLVLGGEILGEDIIKRWAHKLHLFNTYGPAECTIYSTTTTALDSQARGSNIGKAIGCACWVVDQNNYNQLLPVGCIGELLIEGPNLARGYLGDEQKTLNTFVYPTWLVNYRRGGRGRCYVTGDLVKQNRDGTFSFMGRKDSQVKLRGQRIELTEIEHHLTTIIPDQWKGAVEVICPVGYSAQTLAVFYWPEQAMRHAQASPTQLVEITEEAKTHLIQLKDKLAQILPKYMLPTVYVPLTHPPTTATGKLDRRALRNLGDTLPNVVANKYTLDWEEGRKQQPATERERELQDLWARVLGVNSETISTDYSFFQLGGESISAIRLAAAARRMNLHITVAEIFQYPILSEMASRMTKVVQKSYKDKEKGGLTSEFVARISREWKIDYETIEDIYPATWLQNDMITVTRRVPEANTLRYIAYISAEVDIKRYQAAWEQVVADNAILRTRIVRLDDGRAFQVVSDDNIEWKSAETFEEYIEQDQLTPFDYGMPLIRFALLRDASGNGHYFIFTSHHASYDGWSISQMHEIVAKLYVKPSSQLAATPFKDLVTYVERLEMSSDYADFWRSQLKDFQARDFPYQSFPFDKPLTNSVVEITVPIVKPTSTGITVSTLIRAAYAIVIGAHTDTTDVCFGAIQTGRSIPLLGIADILGPTITLVPIRIRWARETTIYDFVSSIQQQSTSMIPYEHVAKANIAALDESCAAACAYRSLLIVQPVENKGTGIDGIRKIPTEHREFLEYCLSLECKLGRSEMVVHADYDDRVLDAQNVLVFIIQLSKILDWLVSASKDGLELVEDLIHKIRETEIPV